MGSGFAFNYSTYATSGPLRPACSMPDYRVCLLLLFLHRRDLDRLQHERPAAIAQTDAVLTLY
jgi:hypothetical protein